MKAAVITALAVSVVAVAAHGQDLVGRTAIVVERVDGTLQTNQRRLMVRDAVHLNELIATAPASASEIVFLDGTALALGPDSKLTLSSFVYDPRPSRQKMTVNAGKSVFRFATGAFSKEKYEIDTPAATIGVRGTTVYCWATDAETICKVTEGVALLTDKKTGRQHPIAAGSYYATDGDRNLVVAQEEWARLDEMVGGRSSKAAVNIPHKGTFDDPNWLAPTYSYTFGTGFGRLVESSRVISPNGLR